MAGIINSFCLVGNLVTAGLYESNGVRPAFYVYRGEGSRKDVGMFGLGRGL